MHGFRFGNDARKNVSCEAVCVCVHVLLRELVCVCESVAIEFSYIHTVHDVHFCGSSWSTLNAAAARTMYEHIVFDAETFFFIVLHTYA